MPEARVPLILDPTTGQFGIPNEGDWLQINERPWLRTATDAEVGANDRVIATEPIILSLRDPYSEVWVYNDSDGHIVLESAFALSGLTALPPGSLAVIAGDGEAWHSFLASPGQEFVSAIAPVPGSSVLTGSPDVSGDRWVEAAGLVSAGRGAGQRPKVRGISFPPQLDEENGTLALSEDVYCIRDQIFSVLRTQKGERPLRQGYGLNDYSFEVRSGFGAILEELRTEIKRQIPELYEVTVSGIYQPVATLALRVDWQLDERSLQAPLGFELAL